MLDIDRIAAIRSACDRFLLEMARLDLRWDVVAPMGAIQSRRRDLQRWLDAFFDELPRGVIDDHDKMLAHDVYLRLIAFAQMLMRAEVRGWADSRDIRVAMARLEAVFDTFTPIIGRADVALRRVVLDGVPIEHALPWAHEVAGHEM
jgi:hypothetical protein